MSNESVVIINLRVYLLVLLAVLMVAGCGEKEKVDHLVKAKDFYDVGEIKSAIIELKNALRNDPNNKEARYLLGKFYVEVGNGGAAEKELVIAEKLGVSSKSIKLFLAKSYLLQGRHKQLLKKFEIEESESDLEKAQLYKVRGDALLDLSSGKAACEHYKNSNDLVADFVDAYWGLSLCAAGLDKDIDKARKLLQKAVSLDGNNYRTWIATARFEQSLSKVDDAKIAYDKALEINPKAGVALFSRALISVSKNQLDDAIRDFDALGRFYPKSLQYYFLDSVISYHKKDFDAVERALAKVEKISPNYASAVLLRALLAVQNKSMESAEQLINRYLVLRPSDHNAQRFRARIYLQNKKPQLAEKEIKKLLVESDKDQQLLVYMGQAHMLQGDYVKASEFFEKATRIDPKNLSGQLALARSYLFGGQSSQGVSVLNALSSLSGGDEKAQLMLAIHYLSNKEFDNTLSSLAHLKNSKKESVVIYNLEGAAYLGKGDIHNARGSWEKALEIDPTHTPAANKLASLDIKDNNYNAARQRYKSIIKNDPKNYHAMLAMADLARQQNNKKDYVSWLERAAKADEKAFLPKLNLVKYYVSINKPQRALATAREAYNNDSTNLDALDLLGRAQFNAGSYDNSLASYQKLVELKPESVSARLEIAGVQKAMRNYTDAHRSLEVALKLAPDNISVNKALGSIMLAMGKYPESLRYANKVKRLIPTNSSGWILEGKIFVKQKKIQQAHETIEKAFALESNENTVIMLHALKIKLGQQQKADKFINEWLTKNSSNITVQSYIASYYMRHKEIDKAIIHYKKILKTQPKNLIALNNLAEIYLQLGDEKSMKFAEKAYKLLSDNPLIADTYGWALHMNGKSSEALRILEKAKNSAPTSVVIKYHYAVVLAANNSRDLARRELKQLLTNKVEFPGRKDASELLKKLEN